MKESTRGSGNRRKPNAKPDAKPETPEITRVDSKAAPGALANGEKVTNWAEDESSETYKEAAKLYRLIVKAYENQSEQSDRIEEYWAIFNAQPDENLQYSGNSSGYVPVVRDAVNARAKRTVKQLFPVNHKHVDGNASDGKTPFTQLSLLEHYIRKTRLKSIVRSDLVAGDVTGQWCLMVDWTTERRRVRELVRKNPIIEKLDGEDVSDLEIEDPTTEEESVEGREVVEEGPDIIDFAVEDLAVIPPTCNDLQRARAVSLRLRLSKDRVEEMVEEGVFVLPEGVSIDDFFEGTGKLKEKRNRAKKQTEEAGIKTEGTNKHLLAFMVYSHLKLNKDYRESAIIYFGGENEILGIIRNPAWSGKVPIISEPVDRVGGSFYGKSRIEPVKFMQWNLCDFWNMGQDSAMYSLLPIYTVDPLKTPQWSQLTMGLAAIWPVAPADVKPMQTPQVWKDSLSICDGIKRQIWESLDVNEMMMGKTPPGRKNNAMIGKMAEEQATAISDHAERYEEVVLSPLVEMLFEFDQQYRTDEVMIEQRGEIGAKAAIEAIPPQQWGERYNFRWIGTAFIANMQRMQQQTAWLNVVKGIPPQMMPGRRLDLTAFVEAGTENIFGPEIAPKIFVDERNMFKIEPGTENEILHNGMVVEVHEADDDRAHIQEHMRGAALAGDPLGLFKDHMGKHLVAMKTKQEKAMGAQQQGGVPGGPPGSGPAGVAGTPRPGAQPAPGGPRPAQNPPGAIPQDNMQGAPGRG